MAEDRPRLLLHLVYCGPDPRQAIRPDLARVLKRLLRWLNWKCVKIEEAPRADARE